MIAFTADNHIGVTTQWSIKERGNDFLDAFSNVVDAVIANTDEEKTLIIGGDLFDTAYPPSFAVEFVQSEIYRLRSETERRRHVFKAFGIDGNHDIADGKWLRVCGIQPLSEEPQEIYTGVKACGLSYQRSASIIEKLNAMADRGVRCDILVLHLAFGELNRMGAASDLSSREIIKPLKAMGVRTVLMGHIHIRQSVEIDGITFAYCGSTELCSMNEPKEKSFDTLDPFTFILTSNPIETRKVTHTVIGTEKEFAAYASSLENGSAELQSVYVVPSVVDGVKRLRDLAKEKHVLMRIQVIQSHAEKAEDVEAIDRTTGITGLEKAISLSFKPDSQEAGLIRAILSAPEALKVTVDNFIKKEDPT